MSRRFGIFGILIGGLILALALEAFVFPLLILKRAEQALKIKITGHIQPVFFKTLFHLNDIQTTWDKKIRIFSGRLDVDYDLAGVLGGQLELRLHGKNMASELLGDWSQLAGGQKVMFDDVFADLIFGMRGIQEIRALRAESPTVQFRFGVPPNGHHERQA